MGDALGFPKQLTNSDLSTATYGEALVIIYLLDLFGVAVFAVSGALEAGRKRMDVFGTVVVAIVTAIGGGTVRDLVLGIRPVLWISHPIYVLVATAAALVTFITARWVQFPTRVLLIFDAFGLAMFTIIGCQRALEVNVSYVIVVVMGVITGVAGGIIRDILCGEIPLVLRSEIYATASLAGGMLFVALHSFGVERSIAAIAAVALILIIRLAAIYWRLSLPVFTEVDE